MKKGLFVAALSCSAVALFGCKGESKVPTKITIVGADYVYSLKETDGSYLTFQYVINAKGSKSVDKTVTWSIDKEDIATISDSGVLTPKAEGTATITATSKADTKIKDTFTVNVVAEVRELAEDKFKDAFDATQKTLINNIKATSSQEIVGTCEEGDVIAIDEGEETLEAVTAVSQIIVEDVPHLHCTTESGAAINISNLSTADISLLNETIQLAKKAGVDCDIRFFEFKEENDYNRLAMYFYHGTIDEETPEEFEYYVFDSSDSSAKTVGCQTRHISYRGDTITADIHASFEIK